MSFRRHLVIFARFPKLGAGKRRLAREIGSVQALRFQRVMLGRLVRRLAYDPRWVSWIAATPDRSGPWPQGVRRVAQGPGDLGRRMARVARILPPGPVVIIGSDIPGISAEAIAQAFRAIGNKDAVFGPAEDGGYWLVGLRRRPRFIDPFAGIAWSTPTVLRDTLAKFPQGNAAAIESLADIDDRAALARHPNWYRFNSAQARQTGKR